LATIPQLLTGIPKFHVKFHIIFGSRNEDIQKKDNIMFGLFTKKEEAPKRKRTYKPAKVFGGGNPWQKKNAKYAKQDEKREKRQMRTGNN